MKYISFHDGILYKGINLGDLFCSLLALKNIYNGPDKIICCAHNTFHELIMFLFSDFVSECINYRPDNTPIIHSPFIGLSNIITKKITFSYNYKYFDNIDDNMLLPDNSTLIILHTSSQDLLHSIIIDNILNVCKDKNYYIRNVIDNKEYDKTYIVNEKQYKHSLMALFKSCMTRKIKIIMVRNGFADVLAYNCKIPMFIIYPIGGLKVGELKEWNFNIHNKNKYLTEAINPNIYEYYLEKYNKDEFIYKLRKFIE